jgi:hypothetical protein
LWTKWSGWAVGIERRMVFQARYGFSRLSSVSLIGGCSVGVGIGIVTLGGICCDIDVEMFTVLVN